jgi:hypothetical protein
MHLNLVLKPIISSSEEVVWIFFFKKKGSFMYILTQFISSLDQINIIKVRQKKKGVPIK